MGKFDSYKIDLRGMQEVNASYDLSVDNAFFAHIDGPEVQKGKVHLRIGSPQLLLDIVGAVFIHIQHDDLRRLHTGDLAAQLRDFLMIWHTYFHVKMN